MHRDLDVLLDAINLPKPGLADVAELDEAYGKVENYLRACRVSSRLHRARLTAIVVNRAVERRAAAAGGPPLSTVAIEEARRLIHAWLAGLLPPRPGDRPHTQAEGFVALYLCDGPMRWPSAFLASGEEPPGFLDTLRARLVKAGPDLEVSSMVPRTIDRGLLPELAESARDTFDRFPILRTLLFWFLFAAVLVALFWYTRQ
jgi:hypothetical protein